MLRRLVTTALATLALAGCAVDRPVGPHKSQEGRQDLADLRAGIWISPHGCQYWIIDDGAEGYMSPRFDPITGRPVCTRVPVDFPGLATGDFRGG